MKTSFLTVLIFLVSFQVVWCAPLHFVSDANFPPYSYYENGKAKGIDLDIVNEAARRAGVDIISPWKRALLMIQTAQADGAFSMFRTKEREMIVNFSKIEFNPPDRKSKFHRIDAELGKMHKDGTIMKIISEHINTPEL